MVLREFPISGLHRNCPAVRLGLIEVTFFDFIQERFGQFRFAGYVRSAQRTVVHETLDKWVRLTKLFSQRADLPCDFFEIFSILPAKIPGPFGAIILTE